MRTAIIGGGASGLSAAITLKRNMPDMEVVVLEKLAEPGKKLLATGNGRCNLSNTDVDVSCYHGDSSTLHHVLNTFGSEECLDFFHSLGLLTAEEDGRIYPLTFHASTVRNVLLEEAARLGISFETEFRVTDLSPGFTVTDRNTGRSVEADFVLLAPGGKAAAAHGTDGDGYPLLKQLGIRYAPISPALVSLVLDDRVRPLKGLRIQGSASLLDEHGTLIAKETGELQFTEKGLSGIPALQLSGDAAVLAKNGHPTVAVDFCPNLPDLAVLDYLRDRAFADPEGPASHLLTGMVREPAAAFLLEAVGKRADSPIAGFGLQDLANLADILKNCPFPLTGTKSFKDAQVTRGGVPADELIDGSLESRRHPGLWFAGELLNVDGACGGYNLHFAWGSGIRAAKEILSRASHQ